MTATEREIKKAINIFGLDRLKNAKDKASLKKIRNQLLKDVHPDKNEHKGINTNEAAKDINSAYETLSDNMGVMIRILNNPSGQPQKKPQKQPQKEPSGGANKKQQYGFGSKSNKGNKNKSTRNRASKDRSKFDYRKVMSFYRKGDFRKVIHLCIEGLQMSFDDSLFQNNARIYYLMGCTYKELGETATAVTNFKKAIEEDGLLLKDLEKNFYKSILNFLDNDKCDDAIISVNMFKDIAPDRTSCFSTKMQAKCFGRGQSAYKNGNPMSALNHFNMALMLDNNNVEIICEIISFFDEICEQQQFECGLNETLISSLLTLSEKTRKNATLLYLIGKIYLFKEMYAEATQYFTKAISIDDGVKNRIQNLCVKTFNDLISKNYFDNIILLFSHCFNFLPTYFHANVSTILAHAYRDKNEEGKSRADGFFKQVIKLRPELARDISKTYFILYTTLKLDVPPITRALIKRAEYYLVKAQEMEEKYISHRKNMGYASNVDAWGLAWKARINEELVNMYFAQER
ncbi:MAG: hypothetical protein HQM16_17875 [Deltaproteobacteria bacterium]|nr:hypothetical protein [Deltaproteobacteria bacterium]